MKNYFSTGIIATALALLVPNNGAEAVGTALPRGFAAADMESMTTASSLLATQSPDPGMAWIMAIGFLVLVISRRLRGD